MKWQEAPEKVNEKNRHLKNLDKLENPTQRMGFFILHSIRNKFRWIRSYRLSISQSLNPQSQFLNQKSYFPIPSSPPSEGLGEDQCIASAGLILFFPFLIKKIIGIHTKNIIPKYIKISIYDITVLCLLTEKSIT